MSEVVRFLSWCFLLLPQSSFGYCGFLSTVCELVQALRSDYDPLISKTHLCSDAKWFRAKGAPPTSLHVLPRSLFSTPTCTGRTLQLYNKFDVEEERGVRCSCRYVLFLASDPSLSSHFPCVVFSLRGQPVVHKPRVLPLCLLHHVSDTEPHGASYCSHVPHLPEQAAISFASRCQRKTPSKPRSRWRHVIQACSVSRR